MLVIGVNVCELKSLNERLNLAHLLGLIGVQTNKQTPRQAKFIDRSQ